MSVKLTKEVFLVPTRTTWGGFITNFLFSPATMSGFFSLMMLKTLFKSWDRNMKLSLRPFSIQLKFFWFCVLLPHHRCSLFLCQPMLVLWRGWTRSHHCFYSPRPPVLLALTCKPFCYTTLTLVLRGKKKKKKFIYTVVVLQQLSLIKIHFLRLLLFGGEHQVQVILFRHLHLLPFNFQLLV